VSCFASVELAVMDAVACVAGLALALIDDGEVEREARNRLLAAGVAMAIAAALRETAIDAHWTDRRHVCTVHGRIEECTQCVQYATLLCVAARRERTRVWAGCVQLR